MYIISKNVPPYALIQNPASIRTFRVVQPPLFHLNKYQETIRLRLSVILGLDELIKWPHAP